MTLSSTHAQLLKNRFIVPLLGLMLLLVLPIKALADPNTAVVGKEVPVSTGLDNNVPAPLALYHKAADPKVDAYVEAAHQALYQGKEQLAEHLLLQAVGQARLMPEDPMALSYATTTLGRLYEATHQFEKAAAVYQEGLVIQRQHHLPSQWASLERLAQVYNELGHTDKAIALYQKLIDYHRRQLTLLNGAESSASISLPLPMTVEARQHTVQLARIYRLQASTYFLAGQNKAGFKAADDMLSAIERAHIDDPLKRFGPYMLLGRWYGRVGQNEKAIFWSLRGIRLVEAELANEDGVVTGQTSQTNQSTFAAVIDAQLPGAYKQLAELYRQSNQLLRSQDMQAKADELMQR